MKRLWIMALVPILCWNLQTAHAQGFAYKLTHPDAVGGGFVASHFDRSHVLASGESTSFGPGFEAFVKYQLGHPGLYITAGTGFYRLTDDMFTSNNAWRNLFPTVELKAEYQLLPQQRFSPFLFAGLQAYYHQTEFTDNTGTTTTYSGFDGGVLGGGGFQYQINNKMSLFASGDYRYIFTDTDEPKAKYWMAKAGISYALNSKPKERETLEYPMDDSDLALAALFKDVPNDEPTQTRDDKPTEEDALALLFQEDEASTSVSGSRENAWAGTTTTQPTTESAAEMPTTETGRLLAKINELRNEMEMKDREITDLKNKVDANERAIVQFSRGVAGQVAGYSDDALAELDMQNFKASYQTALKKHYNKDYAGAIRMFKALLSAQPDHRLASNCQYWIGESYNAMGQYADAIQAFNQVLNYRSSYKLDDALIMAGIVYLKLGNEASAREQFQRLVSNYPDSEYAPKAMRYLGRM